MAIQRMNKENASEILERCDGLKVQILPDQSGKGYNVVTIHPERKKREIFQPTKSLTEAINVVNDVLNDRKCYPISTGKPY